MFFFFCVCLCVWERLNKIYNWNYCINGKKLEDDTRVRTYMAEKENREEMDFGWFINTHHIMRSYPIRSSEFANTRPLSLSSTNCTDRTFYFFELKSMALFKRSLPVCGVPIGLIKPIGPQIFPNCRDLTCEIKAFKIQITQYHFCSWPIDHEWP